MDCYLPGFSVLGISQARVLEWVAIFFSRGSSHPRHWTCISYIAGGLLHCRQIFFTAKPPGKPYCNPYSIEIILKPKCGLLMTAQNKSTPWSALQSLTSPAFLPFYTVDLNYSHLSAVPYPACPSNFPPPCLPSAGDAITALILNGHCNLFFQSQLKCTSPRYAGY